MGLCCHDAKAKREATSERPALHADEAVHCTLRLPSPCPQPTGRGSAFATPKLVAGLTLQMKAKLSIASSSRERRFS